MLQLAEAGYDVWVGNIRGTEYASDHKLFSSYSPEYWNFNWDKDHARMDVPTMVRRVKEMTGMRKIFYIGYSQGTVQMFYGLSHIEESFLQDNLIKFIALAPCSISTGVVDKEGNVDHRAYEGSTFRYHELGIYNVMGPNWETSLKTGCDNFGDEWCGYYSNLHVQPYSTQDEWHWSYNFLQQRF